MITKRVAVPVAAAVAVAAVFVAARVAAAGSGSGSHRVATGGAPRAGTTTGIPPPFPLMKGKEPAECTVADLKVRVSYASSGAAGTLLILRIGSTGSVRHACVLATGGWPVVRLRLSNGLTPIGKADGFLPAVRARPTPFVTYGTGNDEKMVLLLRPGRSVDAVVLNARLKGASCVQADEAMVFPGAAALGASKHVALRTPLAVCGRLSVITYLSSRLGGRARAIGRDALRVLAVACRKASGCREFI